MPSKCFFFQAEDGIRDRNVTGVQTCALPISAKESVMRQERMEIRGSLAIKTKFFLSLESAAGTAAVRGRSASEKFISFPCLSPFAAFAACSLQQVFLFRKILQQWNLEGKTPQGRIDSSMPPPKKGV